MLSGEGTADTPFMQIKNKKNPAKIDAENTVHKYMQIIYFIYIL